MLDTRKPGAANTRRRGFRFRVNRGNRAQVGLRLADRQTTRAGVVSVRYDRFEAVRDAI